MEPAFSSLPLVSKHVTEKKPKLITGSEILLLNNLPKSKWLL